MPIHELSAVLFDEHSSCVAHAISMTTLPYASCSVGHIPRDIWRCIVADPQEEVGHQAVHRAPHLRALQVDLRLRDLQLRQFQGGLGLDGVAGV